MCIITIVPRSKNYDAVFFTDIAFTILIVNVFLIIQLFMKPGAFCFNANSDQGKVTIIGFNNLFLCFMPITGQIPMFDRRSHKGQ
ncbi:hypothetical protein D3C86_1132620 [compost metagenome]